MAERTMTAIGPTGFPNTACTSQPWHKEKIKVDFQTQPIIPLNM